MNKHKFIYTDMCAYYTTNIKERLKHAKNVYRNEI